MTAITDLEIFARVARTGNMSAAAREMGLSPAVVSKRISLLEERLEARLFQRTTRQLTLTDIGSGFFKRVVDILSLVEEAEDFVGRRNAEPKGTLKIVAPTYFGRKYLIPHIKKFRLGFPHMYFEILPTDDDVDLIKEGYDLAIRIGVPVDSSLETRRLTSVPGVFCASAAYLKAKGEPKTLKELEVHDFVCIGAYDEVRVRTGTGVQNARVKGVVKSTSEDFVREAVQAGLGIGLLSLFDIAEDVNRGEMKIILPKYRTSLDKALFAVYPCKEFVPAKINTFVQHLVETFGDERYWDKTLGPARKQVAQANEKDAAHNVEELEHAGGAPGGDGRSGRGRR